MMKFTTRAIVGALCCCTLGALNGASAELVSPTNDINNKNNNNNNAITEGNLETLRNLKYVDKEFRQKNGAAEVGYGMASVRWERNHKNFCFGGVNRILDDFWPEIQRDVIQECYAKYCTLWEERAEDCAWGAETFVWDLADECIDKRDCDNLGDIAAFEVSGIFCFGNQIQFRDQNFFPPLCRFRAKNVCEDLAPDFTLDLIKKRQCKDHTFLDPVEKKKMKNQCERVVEDLSETAGLERDHVFANGCAGWRAYEDEYGSLEDTYGTGKPNNKGKNPSYEEEYPSHH